MQIRIVKLTKIHKTVYVCGARKRCINFSLRLRRNFMIAELSVARWEQEHLPLLNPPAPYKGKVA